MNSMEFLKSGRLLAHIGIRNGLEGSDEKHNEDYEVSDRINGYYRATPIDAAIAQILRESHRTGAWILWNMETSDDEDDPEGPDLHTLTSVCIDYVTPPRRIDASVLPRPRKPVWDMGHGKNRRGVIHRDPTPDLESGPDLIESDEEPF